MEKKPFIRRTIVLMAAQLALLIMILLFFILFSYRIAVENMIGNIENLMQIYGKELENKIENADRLLERLVYKNTDYDMLQSENESDRYYASMNLRKLLDESIVFDIYVDTVAVAESRYETYIARENVYTTLNQKMALRKFSMECAGMGSTKSEWTVKKIGEIPYVYKMYVWQGKAAGIFISVDNFMKTAADSGFERMSLLLADSDDIVWGCYGNEVTGYEPGTPLYQFSGREMQKSNFVCAGGKITLYSFASMVEIMSQIRLNMLVMLFIILVSLISASILIKNIYKEVINPMKNMKDSMDKIQEGSYELRIQTEYDNSEFTMLKNTFNRLMDEIVGLKIKSYEKKIELRETELKCVRLQIRPHFFLNAMTTISSLSMQNRNDEIKIYIDALSKNIRYMFKSGLHTVALSEEIRHVENYFEMQELKYPGCVFYSIEIETGVEEWRIPQMIIHTIIENEYKHAIALDSMLTILIRARKAVKGEEEFLLLEIEDDGQGYPEEVLKRFEPEEMNRSDEGTRIGLWSVRRMMELMYEGENLFRISNTLPAGCINRFWIPKQPVQEFDFENSHNKFD